VRGNEVVMKHHQENEPEYIDRLMDVFLDELLGERKPPDLTARILAARRAELHAGLGEADESLALGEILESEDNLSVQASIVPAIPIRAGESKSPAANVRREHFMQRGWLAFALSMCAVFLLVAWAWYKVEPASGPTVFSELPSANNSELLASPRGGNSEAERAGEPTKIEMELNDIPFGTAAQGLVFDSRSPLSPSGVAERLANDQIVARIDAHLSDLWISLGVAPTQAHSASQRLKNAQAVFTGKAVGQPSSATSGEAGSAGERKESGDGVLSAIEQMLARQLQTGEFAQRWAKLWMQEWLPAGSLQAPQAVEFQAWLTKQINQRRPWNSIAEEMLSVPLPAEPGSRLPPQAFLVSALAGDENRQLVDTIGRSFLNNKLNCVRCHDARSLPESSHGDQLAYWSLVALLNGVSADGSLNEGRRLGIDRQAELFRQGQSPTVFFDRPNGVLQAAEARLPDGQLWSVSEASSPRVALAQWISQSDRFSEATVNHVWSFVFGRPLVPQTLHVENASHAERAELLRFLGQQFKAHDYDLPQLVQWVVSSRAFGLKAVEMDRGRWLSLSASDLDSYQLAELVFAAGPTLGRDRSSSLESSLEMVVEWNKYLGRVETLAQPDIPTSSSAATDVSRVEPATSYLLHATRPTRAQQNFVARLLRANLRWEERVKHVADLCSDNIDYQRVQHLARVLLEQSNGDAQAALLNLLWCVQQQGAT
jgi:hypothetical protein